MSVITCDYCAREYARPVGGRTRLCSPACRVLARVTRDRDDCWNWTAYIGQNGYGYVSLDCKYQLAHRVSYETFRGPIPDGLHIDHLCRNRACVNPWHLEPVTLAENTRRGTAADAVRAHHAARTHCKHGHEFTAENTRLWRGVRCCRACARDRARAARQKQAVA